MSKKICLISDHHLCINPRLWKEAFLYEKEGFVVVVITMWQSADLLRRDKDMIRGHNIEYKCYLNMIPGQLPPLSRFFYRLRKRLAGEAQRFLKFGTGWAISYAPELLIREALCENADLYAAHLECGFFAGRVLVKEGKKVSFDFEDWYSKDYLTRDRAVKLLSDLESFALKNGTFCTAPSTSMAAALRHTYQSSCEITVIYNSFPDEEFSENSFHKPKKNNTKYSLIWTSRTVGTGRGLETLVQALEKLQIPIELHIIGKCANGYEEILRSKWPYFQGHELIFHDFIAHKDLLKEIAKYDLGLAIENKEPANKNTTISNKIFQYLLAGIKVLATDTEGQKEIAAYFKGFVNIVAVDQPEEWKNQIESIILAKNQANFEDVKKIYTENFSWPAQEEKLIKLITEAI